MFKLFGSTKTRQAFEDDAATPAAADGEDARGPAAIRRAADEARDARRWGEAAARYVDYLKRVPDDVGILIQAGNCLKEDGRYEESLEAYKAALAVDPRDADGHLQLGHLLKLMGRRSEMARAFRSSLDLQPRDNPAFFELMLLDAIPGAGSVETVVAPDIYVDVTDLIDYLRANVSLSGIQRVVSNLIIHAAEAHLGSGSVRFSHWDYKGGAIYELDAGLLGGTVSAVAVGRSDRQFLDKALTAILEGRKRMQARPGDTLLIAGAFWIYEKYELLNRLRRSGVVVALFIHDLIQVSNPEYVAPAATAVFRRSFTDILNVTDYVLTNSEYVAGDVRRFLAQRMNFQLPVTAVPLATELGYVDSCGEVPADYHALREEGYVMCVATIEIRKNHAYLIRLWERLLREFDGHVPNLVFVGKWGWKIEELQQHLDGSDYLGGRLHVFNGISDRDLAFLYENCLFTMYASFAEGWGLPVGESLGYGKLCVASDRTSIPEVGGSFCLYFDPTDLDSGYDIVADLLADRAGLQARTDRIRREFRPKTWRAFSNELLQLVEKRREEREPSNLHNNCLIEVGDVAPLGDDPLAQLDRCKHRLVTARMARTSGWHDLEAWGCWAAKRRAVLTFATNLPAGAGVDVFLNLKTPDRDECATCTIVIGGSETFVDELSSAPSWCSASGTVGPGGVVEVVIVSGSGFFHRYNRELFVGLIALAVVPSGDAAMEDRLMRRIVRRGRTKPARGAFGALPVLEPSPAIEYARAEAF